MKLVRRVSRILFPKFHDDGFKDRKISMLDFPVCLYDS